MFTERVTIKYVDIPSVLYDTENNMNQTQTLLTRASADEGHIKKRKEVTLSLVKK